MFSFFDTRTQEYRLLNAATPRKYLTNVMENNQVDLVVMEACGPSGWIKPQQLIGFSSARRCPHLCVNTASTHFDLIGVRD